MILNREQQEAVENGEPVALNVGGTECVLVRRDIYLRLDPELDTEPWTIEEMNLLADEAEEMISRRETQSETFGSGQTQYLECEALSADHPEIQARERARQQRFQLSNPTGKQAGPAPDGEAEKRTQIN